MNALTNNYFNISDANNCYVINITVIIRKIHRTRKENTGGPVTNILSNRVLLWL